MPSTTPVTASQLARLIGVGKALAIVDVRIDDYRADPRWLPSSCAERPLGLPMGRTVPEQNRPSQRAPPSVSRFGSIALSQGDELLQEILIAHACVHCRPSEVLVAGNLRVRIGLEQRRVGSETHPEQLCPAKPKVSGSKFASAN